MCYIEEDEPKGVDYPAIMIVSLVFSAVITGAIFVISLILPNLNQNFLVVFLSLYLIICLLGYWRELEIVKSFKDHNQS